MHMHACVLGCLSRHIAWHNISQRALHAPEKLHRHCTWWRGIQTYNCWYIRGMWYLACGVLCVVVANNMM
jgi:hypothetical protein